MGAKDNKKMHCLHQNYLDSGIWYSYSMLYKEITENSVNESLHEKATLFHISRQSDKIAY